MTINSFSKVFAFCMASASVVAQEHAGFALKDGDRVVFYGDSITDQRLYTTFAESYVVTRFPKMHVSFTHSGWGGDRVSGGGGGPIDLRLKRDVFAYKPTVMTIMLGMNDASYRAFDEGIFKQYTSGYEHIVSELKKNLPGLRLTLVQPSPFDEVTRPSKHTYEGGYNGVLKRYGAYVQSLAEREHFGLADLNTPVVEALEKAKAANPELSQKLIPDLVHPAPSGQLVMAAALLKSWNAPGLVSNVEIDAKGKAVAASANTSVSGLEVGEKTVSWTQTDMGLPMPIDMNDAPTALAVKSSELVRNLNQETLKVAGLAAGEYNLAIDGASVGTFSADQLGAGVNLGLLATPMMKQALEVHKQTLQHNNLHFARWRQVQVPYQQFNGPNMDKAMAGLDALEEDLVKAQIAAAQPKARKHEISAK